MEKTEELDEITQAINVIVSELEYLPSLKSCESIKAKIKNMLHCIQMNAEEMDRICNAPTEITVTYDMILSACEAIGVDGIVRRAMARALRGKNEISSSQRNGTNETSH